MRKKKKAAGWERSLLARRMGMTLPEFRKVIGAVETPAHRIGLPIEDFRSMILKSNSAAEDPEKLTEDLWSGKHYAYFSNKQCEYYPCHPGVDPENFNCLFCYCPLYMLGSECGGSFRILDNGYKDCSACQYPHRAENYNAITMRYADILARMAEQED